VLCRGVNCTFGHLRTLRDLCQLDWWCTHRHPDPRYRTMAPLRANTCSMLARWGSILDNSDCTGPLRFVDQGSSPGWLGRNQNSSPWAASRCNVAIDRVCWARPSTRDRDRCLYLRRFRLGTKLSVSRRKWLSARSVEGNMLEISASLSQEKNTQSWEISATVKSFVKYFV